MSYSDKNKIFFGLLHYIFTEQSNVNWAFKTSLINYTGINENVSQRKYKNDSISNDIIKYVKDIKPYHVQFDHYIEKFTAKDDIANVRVNDILYPEINVRYDAVSVKPDIEDYLYTQGSIQVVDTIKYTKGKFKDIKFSLTQYTDENGNKQWCYGGIIDFDENYHLPFIINHNNGIPLYQPLYQPIYAAIHEPIYKPIYEIITRDITNPIYKPLYQPIYQPIYQPVYKNEIVDSIYKYDDFPEEWGKIKSAFVTTSINEDRTDWVYIISVHFENGTLPIIIRNSSWEIEINLDYFEENTDERLNSASWISSYNKWINTIADDNNMLRWYTTDLVSVGPMSYLTAVMWGWDYEYYPNKHPTVFTIKFKAEVTENNDLIIYFNNDNGTYSEFKKYEHKKFDIIYKKKYIYDEFPEEWGEIKKVYITNTRIDTKYDSCYAISVHFENGTLPIIMYKNKTFIIDINNFEQYIDDNYNSAVWISKFNRWFNAVAKDNDGLLQWDMHNLRFNNGELYNNNYPYETLINGDNIATFTLNVWGPNSWDYGNYSVYTPTYSVELTDNKIINIKDKAGNIIKSIIPHIYYDKEIIEDYEESEIDHYEIIGYDENIITGYTDEIIGYTDEIIDYEIIGQETVEDTNNIIGYDETQIIGWKETDETQIIGYTDEIIGYTDEIIGYDDSNVNPENAPEPIYNLNFFEKSNEDFNSIVYDLNKWILTNAKYKNNGIEFYKNNEIKNTINISDITSYEHPNWDYGKSSSYTTDTYYGKITNNGKTLSIYTCNDKLFKKYDIEEFSEKYTETTFNYSFNFDKQSIGTKFYDYNEKAIYKLIEENNERKWIIDSYPVEGSLYYFKKEDSVKIYESRYNPYTEQNSLDMYDLSYDELRYFENTTMANRLFLYKTHNLDEIKDYLNAHFKGITVDGGEFNIDRFGYDAFLYDKKPYEFPVKSNIYYLAHLIYKPISVGTNVIKLDYPTQVSKNNIKIYRKINNITYTIKDYSIDEDNIITIFENVNENEEIIVEIYPDPSSSSNFKEYFKAYTFIESNDENITKQFYSVYNTTNIEDMGNCYILPLPESSFEINNVKVSIEKPNGYRKNITNYKIKNKNVIIPKNVETNYTLDMDWKIYISIADYSLLYDKIYTWEDVYGISNNNYIENWKSYYENMGLVQNLDGGEFLDPYYSENRPSELTVSYPQDTLTIYVSKANAIADNYEGKIDFTAKQIYNFDYKNLHERFNTVKSAKLLNDFNIGDTEISFNKDIFEDPYVENDIKYPGKLLIDSELIEYFEKEINDDNIVTLKKIRRGTNGSFIHNKTISKNTIGYAYRNPKSFENNLFTSYYFVKNINMKKFSINGNIALNDLISVYKTNNITLLSNIDNNSTSFIISNNTIQLPTYDENNNLIKKGYMFIDNDKIFFENITQNEDGTYTISDFDNPYNKKYDYGTQIPSKEFIKLSENDYTIYSEKYEDNKILNYISLNTNPKVGECIIIENRNKNVFD